MEIANPSVSSVGHAGATFWPVPGTTCVFDVPNVLGQTLIGLPHMGWRYPVPGDWTTPRVEATVAVEAPAPAFPAPQRETLAEGPEPTPEDVEGDDSEDAADPEPEPEPVAPGPGPVEPDPVDDVKPATLADKIVALALHAGSDGITRAQVRAAHGDTAYAAVDGLVSSGRLVKVGRGQYRHPSFT